jgi:hypothetical protein
MLFDGLKGLPARALVLVCTCCALPGYAQYETGALERAAVFDECFRSAVDRGNRADPARSVPLDASTSIFIAEQMVIVLASQQPPPSDEQLRGVLCDEAAALYIQRAQSALDAIRRRNDGLARMGTPMIASEKPVVDTYQKLVGRHFKGHSDISMRAAGATPVFSPAAVELFAAASQAPDLFRWEDDRYHAQSPAYDLASGKVRAQADGAERFTLLLENLAFQAKARADAGDSQSAIALMGFAAHMLQDLVYHRGMTLQQHAGLSYFANRDPDQPAGSLAKSRLEEADETTRWFVTLVISSLQPAARERIVNWRPAGGYSTEKVVRDAFGLEGGSTREDIGTIALIRYWLLSRDYALGRRPADELEDRPCSDAGGLACWDVAAIRGRLTSALEKR